MFWITISCVKSSTKIFIFLFINILKETISAKCESLTTCTNKYFFLDQSKFYEAFLSTFLMKKWSLGVMVWNYELDPNAGKAGPTLKSYTPQNKPAQEVLRRFYEKAC